MVAFHSVKMRFIFFQSVILTAGAVITATLPIGTVQAQLTARDLIGKADVGGLHDSDIDHAITLFRQRDIGGCRAQLVRARDADPKLPPPGVLMAKLWLAVDQLQPARAELEDTAAKYPGDPEPYLMLGDLTFQDHLITDSDVLFARATELTAAFTENPKRKRDFEIRCHAGSAAVAECRNHWDVAQKHLAGWLDLDPDNASARQRLGIVFLQQASLYDDPKQRDTAEKLIEQAVKLSPQDPALLLALAQWYVSKSDLEKAKELADRLVKIDPNNLKGMLIMGWIARCSRDYKTAETIFDNLHRQSPDDFPASNSLTLVLIEGEAAESRQRALEIAEANVAMNRDNANEVTALTTLAWVYHKMGRRDDAEKILPQITQNSPQTTDSAYYIAALLADRGEKDRARRILENLLVDESMFVTRADAIDLIRKLGGHPRKAPPKARNSPDAKAIADSLTRADDAWNQAEQEAANSIAVVPQAVWEDCMSSLVKIPTDECPRDFQEAWEGYLLACKDRCDYLISRGTVINLSAAAAKVVRSAGSSLIDEIENQASVLKQLTDAELRLRIVAKRHGVEW